MGSVGPFRPVRRRPVSPGRNAVSRKAAGNGPAISPLLVFLALGLVIGGGLYFWSTTTSERKGPDVEDPDAISDEDEESGSGNDRADDIDHHPASGRSLERAQTSAAEEVADEGPSAGGSYEARARMESARSSTTAIIEDATPGNEKAGTGPNASARKPSALGGKAAKNPGAAKSDSNLFTLYLDGTLGTGKLDRNDAQTWARLSYFLSEESLRRYFLVYPGGAMPQSQPLPSATPLKQEKKAPAAARPGPTGDPVAPRYRLAVWPASKSEGAITFYGTKMASKYRCTIACAIEVLEGKAFREIDRLSVSEEWTPGTSDRTPESTALRKVYDVCLEKLVKELARRSIFTRK
jgi:hypothetical protein